MKIPFYTAALGFFVLHFVVMHRAGGWELIGTNFAIGIAMQLCLAVARRSRD